MGRYVLILLLGFAVSFGILAQSQNSRMVQSVGRVSARYESYTAKNTSTSGAYMTLNKLYLSPDTLDGLAEGDSMEFYGELAVGTDSLTVTIQRLDDFQFSVFSQAKSADTSSVTELKLYDGTFDDFPVWCKGAADGVVDSTGASNSALVKEYAPFMPDIDKDALIDSASHQGNVYDYPTGTTQLWDGYRNDNGFLNADEVPDVTYVTGNLEIGRGERVYGIFVVDGNVLLHGLSEVYGVIYLPNAGSRVVNVARTNTAYVYGGIIARGEIEGTYRHITLYQRPGYMDFFANSFVPNNPQIRVTSWK